MGKELKTSTFLVDKSGFLSMAFSDTERNGEPPGGNLHENGTAFSHYVSFICLLYSLYITFYTLLLLLLHA